MPRPTRTVIPRNFNLDLPVASTSQITNASISAQTKEKVTKKRKLNPAPQVEPEEVVKTVGRVESIQAVKNKQKSGKKAVELIEFETELVEKKSKPVSTYSLILLLSTFSSVCLCGQADASKQSNPNQNQN